MANKVKLHDKYSELHLTLQKKDSLAMLAARNLV